MKTAMRMLTTTLALTAASLAHAGPGEGLRWQDDTLSWARWQARLAISQPAPLWRAGFDDEDSTGLKARSLSIMGDYAFARFQSEDGRRAGVLRATSGLVFGPRPTLWAGRSGFVGAVALPQRRLFGEMQAEPATLPYVGVGYSGLAARGSWSLSADFGLMALGAGNAVRLGRSGNYQGIDDLVRELRLTPVLQVGASYAF